jgi:quercetin dioxygenase-like cupin family protein
MSFTPASPATPLIRAAEARRTETPAGVMTTLASPAQGGTATAVWRVDMAAGAHGPEHTVDAEQVWTVLAGGAAVRLGGGEPFTAGPGDTFVLPAGAGRRIAADAGAGLAAIVVAPAGMRAYAPGVEVHPHCAVPAGDGLIPAWVV